MLKAKASIRRFESSLAETNSFRLISTKERWKKKLVDLTP
jgi:hypothetical protein